MNFQEQHKSPEKYYSVGIDKDSGRPVIEVTTTGHVWRDYYFHLTPEEYSEFLANRDALDDLAERLAHDKGQQFYADRFICSR